MKIYVAELQLHNFLTFSSSVGFAVIGGVSYPVYRPQPYIHNYALMYGFKGIPYASLASVVGEYKQIDYSLLNEVEDEIYVFPARPRSLVIKRMLCNIKGEGYAEPVQPRPKTMYPWHVAHMYIAPGSIFETVVLVKREGVRLPNVIRIGVKRQGVFKVRYVEASVEGHTNGYSDPVNLGDAIRFGAEPDSYVVLLTTKTERLGVPYSNYVVKGYYTKKILAVVQARIGSRIVEFKLPIPSGFIS